MESNAQHDPASPVQPPTSRQQSRVRALLPWLSMLVGVISAISMERGPERGPLIAFAAISVWLFLIAQQWLARRPRPPQLWAARLLFVGKHSTLMLTQSLLQLTLYFALPFFARAADFRDSGHVLFMVVVGALAAAALWDPWTEWLFAHPRWGPLLPAFGSFVALCGVLPGLGLSTRASLWIAAGVASGGTSVVIMAGLPREQRWPTLPRALLLALALPLALALGLTRVIPAAPLRLAAIDFGTGLRDHELTGRLAQQAAVPSTLYCGTAIAAPLGVRDRLFHIWKRDGGQIARVELAIRGGRQSGYRTASRIKPGRRAGGTYRCSVVTASGQVLGGKSIELLDAQPAVP